MPPVMLAFFVPAESAKALQGVQDKLKAEKPTAPEEMHVTLAYLGQSEEMEEDLPFLCVAVRRFASKLDPLDATIGGTAQFPKGEDGIPYVALVDCPGLPVFREALVSYLEEDVGALVRKDHGFSPHVTLAYVPNGQGHIEYEPIPVRFTHLSVAWGNPREGTGVWKHYKLGERHPADVVLDTLTTSAKRLFDDDRDCLEELEVLRTIEDLNELEVEAGKALGVSIGAVNLMLEENYGDTAMAG